MGSALDRAYEAIRTAILHGEYEAGAPLREEELAAVTGVSRTPVREALRRLAAQGLVEIVPNHGARVASLTREDTEEVFELRLLIEGYAVRKAAERIDGATLDELDALVTEMRTAAQGRGDDVLEKLADLNHQFHTKVLNAARSTRITTLVNSVIVASLMVRTFESYSAEEREQSLRHHRELVRALRAADPEWAASVIHNHIRAAWNALRPSLPGE